MPIFQLSSLATAAIGFLSVLSVGDARPSNRWGPSKDPQNGLSGYTIPTSDGKSLPPPTDTLKAITIGRGTQNYTCTSPINSSSLTVPTPVAIGAVADLLDASPLLKLIPPEEGIKILQLLPEYLVNFDISLLAQYSIPLLGHHYFNKGGQPVFDLGSTGLLIGKKVANITAPANASPGSMGQGFGAVDWLELTDAGESRGVNGVYRVVTAGGKAPPTCAGQPKSIQVQYAALYWFYA